MTFKIKYLFFVLGYALTTGCAKEITTDTVQQALVGQNYWLMESKDKYISQVEFLEKCSRHFNWEAFVVDEWQVKEVEGKVVLNFDTNDFTPTKTEKGDLEFVCEKNGHRLVKTNPATFDRSQLAGKWTDAHYFKRKLERMTPCPDGTPGVFPSISFDEKNCTMQDSCGSKVVPYTVNPVSKTICLGEPCTEDEQQWRILKIQKDLLVFNVRKMVDGRVGYEFNKQYVNELTLKTVSTDQVEAPIK